MVRTNIIIICINTDNNTNIIVCINELLQLARHFNDVWDKSKGCWDRAEIEMGPEDKHIKENGLFLASNSLCHYNSSLVAYNGS